MISFLYKRHLDKILNGKKLKALINDVQIRNKKVANSVKELNYDKLPSTKDLFVLKEIGFG